MPTGCRTVEKDVAPYRTPDGEWLWVRLPWCVEHGRWFTLCQHRVQIGLDPAEEQLPHNVVDINIARRKRTEG